MVERNHDVGHSLRAPEESPDIRSSGRTPAGTTWAASRALWASARTRPEQVQPSALVPIRTDERSRKLVLALARGRVSELL